jgi:hypothetical protein
MFHLLILIILLKHAQKNKTLNKHLTSKLQFSPNFTPDSVADSNYRRKCDVGGFLIFEWTLIKKYGNVFRIFICMYSCGNRISGSIFLSLQQNLCKPTFTVIMTDI